MYPRRSARRPSPALMIASIALFVSLGGAAYAVNLGKNDVKSRNIARGAVEGSDLAKNAVKTSKVKAGAIKSSKIAAEAVVEDLLAEDAVARRKIKAQAVTTPKIADLAVETAKLADGNVTTEKLADGAVTAAKLGAGSVTGAAMLATTTITVDPPGPGPACAEGTDSTVPGATADDHVVVTGSPGSAVDLVATGEAGDGAVSIHVCNIGGSNPASETFNVLVID